MINYTFASAQDLPSLLRIRLEMLKIVNNLPEDHQFPDVFISQTRDYFLAGDQTTVLAFDDDTVIGCATICYIRMMPTFSHPTGSRAHLMNVYTAEPYRRRGIARKMVSMLIDVAWQRGATEISLDATQSGRPIYESLGFTASDECMILTNHRVRY